MTHPVHVQAKTAGARARVREADRYRECATDTSIDIQLHVRAGVEKVPNNLASRGIGG
jgi:hypothetical protein